MPKKSEDVDEAAETVELDGTGKKDGKKNAKRQRQRRSRNKRVKILGIAAAVIIMILIIIGAWFIYTSLHDGRPEWLQTIPGLHYRPINEKVETLISFRGPDESSYKPWVAVIDKFLEEYRNPRNNAMICDFNNFPQGDKFCYVDLKEFGYCVKENLYGYYRQTPCVFIKLHKFPNWTPEYYNDTSVLPEKMPPELVEHIVNTVADNPFKWQTLWLDCNGITGADKENIGTVEYYPERGFKGYYFPASDKEGYLSPLVALHLTNPRTGVLINIECKVWAKNIPVDSESEVGVVQFEILID